MNTKQALAIKSMVVVALISAAVPAMADRDEGRHGGGEWRGGERREWHGDIRHFDREGLHVWQDGRWIHDRHDGRWGWWWFAGGMWYFYPRPVYPYPDPYIPPVVVQQQPASPPVVAPQTTVQVWYYCEAGKGYYPYVASCPGGWKTVPATPTAAASMPPPAQVQNR